MISPARNRILNFSNPSGISLSYFALAVFLLHPMTIHSQDIPASLRQELKRNIKTKAILNNVESHFGTPVKITINNNAAEFEGGAANINADGVPEIILNGKAPNLLKTLIHELLHLEYRVQGIRRYTFASEASLVLTNEQVGFLGRYVMEEARDGIQHHFIFLRMKTLGVLEPEQFLRWTFEQHLGDLRSLLRDPLSRRAFYFRAALELEGTTTLRKIEDSYSSEGWSDEITLVKAIVVEVRQVRTLTPETESILLIKAMNAILKGSGFNVSLAQVSPAPKKGLHVDQEGLLLVTRD